VLTAWVLLGVSVLLVVAAGAFVAAEFSFVTVDRSKVAQVADAGDARAAGVLKALRSLSTQLSGAQVGITITNLAIGFLAEPAIAQLISDPLESAGVAERAVDPIAVAIGLTISSVVTMVFAELVPKNLAIAKPMETARATQGFQRLFTAVMRGPMTSSATTPARKAAARTMRPNVRAIFCPSKNVRPRSKRRRKRCDPAQYMAMGRRFK